MKKILLILFLIANTWICTAQIIVTEGISPISGVQNVLLGGGVTISNIQYSGVLNSFGAFTTAGTPTNLGLSSGIIMSTGKVSGAAGSADFNASTSNNSDSDPQLAAIASASVNDVAVLQFDFIPLSDTVQFRYVFGSEEYPEYVNEDFNDIFGFFISGPNPSGGTYTHYNIAKIPGTNLPVSIDNVNNGKVEDIYLPTGPCMNCQYYVHNKIPDNPNPYIAYDGMTTVLTAVASVVPCQTYHIKIAIGDVGDRMVDSGVFLEANSFSSPTMTVQLKANAAIRESSVVEGCSDANVVFRLPKKYMEDIVVHYDKGGSAVEGIDYSISPNPDSIVIPAGADSGYIHINPFQDNIVDPGDTIYLIIPGIGCSSIVDTLKIPLIDNSPIVLNVADDQLLCDGGMGFLTVSGTRGVAPYTYQWSTGAGNVTSVDVFPEVTTSYYVTATDLCNNSSTDSIKVMVGSLMYEISNDTIVCPGSQLTLNSTFPGNVTWGNQTGNPINIVANQTQIFQVSMSNVCGVVTDSVMVNVYSFSNLNLGGNATHCDNETHEFSLSGVYDRVDWYYSETPSALATFKESGNQFSANESGVYYAVANLSSCSDTTAVVLTFIPCEITAPNIFTPNNDGVNDVLKFTNLEYYSGSSLTVYNRWGRVVYKNEDYKNDWNGEGLGDGIYYYILNLPTDLKLNGMDKWSDTISGSITIMR